MADVHGVCRSGGISLSQAAVLGCSSSTGEEGISIKINSSSSQGGELSNQGEAVPLQLVDLGNPLLMLQIQAWHSQRPGWCESTSAVSKRVTLQRACAVTSGVNTAIPVSLCLWFLSKKPSSTCHDTILIQGQIPRHSASFLLCQKPSHSLLHQGRQSLCGVVSWVGIIKLDVKQRANQAAPN